MHDIHGYELLLNIQGSSLGGIVIPIMLNNLFNKKSAGFAWGVRYVFVPLTPWIENSEWFRLGVSRDSDKIKMSLFSATWDSSFLLYY